MKIFKLPDLGEGLPDAVIREWSVKPGDMLVKDQPMVAMETAKALVDVPAPFSGKVVKLFGAVGDTIDTGNPLIGFEGVGAEEPEDAGTVVGSIDSAADTVQENLVVAQKTPAPSSVRVKATPAVRMLAKQLGVDLTTVHASGDSISAEDVKRAANRVSESRDTKLSGNFTPLPSVRRAMAISMEHARQQVVPASIMEDANLSAWQEKQDITLRIIHALAVACQQVPLLNSYYDGMQMALQYNKQVNVGIAVDTEQGLYVPVLKDVANRDAGDLRADINRFKQQARERSIPQEDLKGATILMSNVGAIAGQYAVPVVTPPMVAIVAMGRIKETVVLEKGKPLVHPLMPISLTFDHRPITGGEAARFLRAMIAELEKP